MEVFSLAKVLIFSKKIINFAAFFEKNTLHG